ncbi:MAG: ribosomal protein L11 methyltransferase [Sphingobacteriales bacterium]|jgi:ribosomal protein L11 methyltransferase
MIQYLEIRIESQNEDFYSILSAELSELGYESFVEEEDALLAYVDQKLFEAKDLENLQLKYQPEFSFFYKKKAVENKNWNKEWEESYQPLILDSNWIVRATFHKPNPGIKNEIIINPEMAFGTGHHATTESMMRLISAHDWKDKQVADLGCGTAILGIMASKLGAKSVLAIDNDENAVRASIKNGELNDITNMVVKEGTVKIIDNGSFYGIFANITRNILLEEIPIYSNLLETDGILLLSGFYMEDLSKVEAKANQHNLKLINKLDTNNWAAAQFIKH